MSKRFGRRQKQRYLQQIVSLENDNRELLNRNKHLSEDNEKAVDIIKLAMRLNPKSTLFYPSSIRDCDRYTYENYEDLTPLLTCDGSLVSDTIKISEVDLYKLHSTLRDYGFQDDLHFEVSFENSKGCLVSQTYAISKEGLKNVDINYLSNRIAEDMKRCINEENDTA